MKKIDLQLIVRGLAASWVMVWHFEAAYVSNALKYFLVPGRTAVWIFFGLSGYVIFHAFEHGKYTLAWQNLRQFYRNRLLRIYPLFLLCTAAILFARLLNGAALPSLDLHFLVTQVLAFQYVHHYELNGVFWTLGVEIWFYLLAPLFYLALRNVRSLPLAFRVYAYLFALSVIEAIHFRHHDVRTLTSNLGHFYVGLIALRFGPEIRSRVNLRPRTIVGIAFLAFVFSGTCMAFAPRYGAWIFYVVGALAVDAGILLLLLLQPELEQRRSQARWLGALLTLGVISYGVYVWHPAVVYALEIDVTTAPWPLVYGAMVISLIVAWLGYNGYERHFLAFKRYGRKAGSSTTAADARG